ncbi:gamma-aminobutyric acid type B receptor subunit 2-like [Pecten maximus]|uniref:gamma-aminobutyric acid type B receptor subunit 2-like n=1 Tax=Pecten maximus TaxID=6579 RepID=UPI0014582092|nr:gamma-aminobutyric acid type B receptor subunit 2-like [Pecten maximus]
MLYIGGLFDIRGSRASWMGRSELTAAETAIRNINELKFIDGFSLQLLENDTQCDPGVGTDAFYDLIYRRPRILMVIGSACSEVTETLAEIVPYWNLILVSYASTSPALSEREKYKTFFRLAPTDAANNPARALFLQHFRWNAVATVYENKEEFYLAMAELTPFLEQHNISVKATESFGTKAGEITSKMKSLKDSDSRIIIGAFSEPAARQVLCEAYRLKMYGARYVWLIIGDFVEKWWTMANDTDCSQDDLRSVAEGYFTVASFNTFKYGKGMSVANITFDDFQRNYLSLNGTTPMSPYATSAYDTVWTVALTLRELLQNPNRQLNTVPYDDARGLVTEMMATLEYLTFDGLSGPVSFQGPDRRGLAVVKQNQGGHMVTVAMYELDKEILNFHCLDCVDVHWMDGKIPKDKVLIVMHKKMIEDRVFYVITSCCAVGIIAATCFLCFNLCKRKSRYIKLSSPTLNNVAVGGCILVYGGVMLLGFDDRRIRQDQYPVFCTTRAFFFAAGFSLAFGSMFTKTYRVHQIFTRANRGLIKNKLLKDKQLLFIIGALLVIDSSILIVWIFVDPMHRQIANLTVGPSDEDIDVWYISQISTCHSNHIQKWLGAFYAFKGLLLVFGVYMAWETRNVKIPVLNDSQYIGLNVYNVVLMSSIVVVLSNILSDQPTMAYILESAFVLLSTSVTLCLLFVPKIYAILTCKGDPVVVSSGIVVEDKTRRFLVDEKRDLYYRAEVQNRVYKREIVELDQEICRLERLLELPLQPFPKLTDDILHLLPESRVDPSPAIRRRRLQELERCNSISDGGEVCFGLSSETSGDDFAPSVHNSLQPNSKPVRRMSIREAASATAKKLSELRRSLSFRAPSRKGTFSVSDMSRDTHASKSEFSLRHYFQDIDVDDDDTLGRTNFSSMSRKWNTDSTICERSRECNNSRKPSRIDDSRQGSKKYRRKSNVFDLQVKITPCSDDESSVENAAFCENRKDSSTKARRSLHRGDFMRPCKSTGDMNYLPLCRVTDVDTNREGKTVSKLQNIEHLIARERRRRIIKLQSDLVKIQHELKALSDLEYEVSDV